MLLEKKALASALRILKIRPRSCAEIRKYLLGKGIDLEAVEITITELEKRTLIDDERFAMEWTENRALGERYGPIRVRHELEKKMIDLDLINAALDIYYPPAEQRQKVMDLWKGFGSAVQMDSARLARKLVSRGFDQDFVAEAAEKIL